jgi:hypothetical protein
MYSETSGKVSSYEQQDMRAAQLPRGPLDGTQKILSKRMVIDQEGEWKYNFNIDAI